MIEVAIRFTNGRLIEIPNVQTYRYNDDVRLFVVETDKYNLFFPREQVVYIGEKLALSINALVHSDWGRG